MTGLSQGDDFELTGGALCLDFANTLGDRPLSSKEHLATYGDLLRFTRQAGSLSREELERLERLYEGCDGCVEPVFVRAVELREALYRIFSALAAGEEPRAGDFALLNRVLAKALRQMEVRPCERGYAWAWAGPAQALDRPLWPIARSAAELLTSGDLGSLRECDGEACSWLFLDRSRNQRRRWCDMAICGNRAKARRHYRRQRREPGSGGSASETA